MVDRDLESRIQRLPDDKRKEFDERLEVFEEELEKELLEQHRSEIDNRITSDESELNDFNVVVSGFLEQSATEYEFVRTEPLIHDKDKNFDVLVAAPSKGVVVLVEIERTLLDRLPSKLLKFAGKVDVVESNTAAFDVDEYFEDVLSTAPDDIDYVLSSQFLEARELQEVALSEDEFDLEFVAWMLASHGNTCRIKDYTIKRDKTSPFDGHSDGALTEYIQGHLESGVEWQDYISFTSSSSKYLKLKEMSIALMNRYQRHTNDGSFSYEDWKQLFEAEVDIHNYLEEEKRTLFKRYIKYAKEVGVVSVVENNGGRFENEYRVVSRATKNQEKLIDELMEKMAKARMQDDYEETVREQKEEVLTELERSHATGGTTLDDFIDSDGGAESDD